MKTRSFSMLAGAVAAAASLQCFAMLHGDERTGADTAAPPAANMTDVRSSNIDLWDQHKLDAQIVRSQGGTQRAGPRNRHVQPPHGGPVAVGNRNDAPGRE